MSAEVTIVVDNKQEAVLTVPLQAILGSPDMGKQRKCFVLNSDGQAEERDIVVGLSNDKMAEIKAGLAENEAVVLNPKALLSDKAKAKLAVEMEQPDDGAGKPGGFGEPGSNMKGAPGQRPPSVPNKK